MPAISFRPDMNSRQARQRPHKSRISRRKAVSNRDGVIEAADQREQGGIRYRLIPVVENCAEQPLALDGADGGAEDDRHPKQRGKTSAEADAAKCRKNDNDDHAQGEPNDHPGRSQFLRKIGKLPQDAKLRRSRPGASPPTIRPPPPPTAVTI